MSVETPQNADNVSASGECILQSSMKTRPVLNRVTGTSSQGVHPDGALLEELLSSLKTDQFVLKALQEELSRFSGENISAEKLTVVAQRCAELGIECDVIGANAALMCGASEKAGRLLQRVAQQDMSFIPDRLRPILFKLAVSVAWVIGDKNEVVLLLKAAKLLDKDGRFSGYLDGVQRLLRARAELRDGGCDTAVRICQTLDRDTRPGDPLKVLALELHADAFRSMGDTDREQKVLEDWEYLLRAMPNGPCDLAAGTEQSPSTFPGILGGSRSEEILQHYSRLAFLYERNRDTREYAKGIYIKFLNTAYHKWIDPGMRDKGSIEQRLAGLVSAGNRPAGDGKHRLGLSIIEPDRMYGKVSDKALEEMLEELSSMPAANYYAIVVGQVDMKERQFRIHEPLGTPLSQLLKEMQLIIDEGDQALSTFQPENISVVWKGQPAEWIVLSHKESAADIRSLSFGLRADKVGEQIDLALYILYAYRPPLNPDSKNELSGLLKKKPGDLAGYNALQGIAMELVKRTAKRVDQKAGRADGSRHQKGPIPL